MRPLRRQDRQHVLLAVKVKACPTPARKDISRSSVVSSRAAMVPSTRPFASLSAMVTMREESIVASEPEAEGTRPFSKKS